MDHLPRSRELERERESSPWLLRRFSRLARWWARARRLAADPRGERRPDLDEGVGEPWPLRRSISPFSPRCAYGEPGPLGDLIALYGCVYN